MIRRSSDIPAKETEFDKSVDEIAQALVEGHFSADWRKPYHKNKGRDWAWIGRSA